MAKQKKVVRTRRRERKNVVAGQAHVQSTFNNTIISISDVEGNVIAWGSAGAQGFKGSRKSTPFAAQTTAEATAKKALEHGMRSIEVFVRGPGAGREAAIRSLQATDLFLAEVLGALVRIDAGVLDDLLGGRVADAVDVGHGDDDALGRRNVDAGDSCHLVPYPCRCLCLGVLEQITRTTPLRLITLQLAHIFLTDGRTFISKSLEFARATGRWSRARHPPCLRQAAG